MGVLSVTKECSAGDNIHCLFLKGIFPLTFFVVVNKGQRVGQTLKQGSEHAGCLILNQHPIRFVCVGVGEALCCHYCIFSQQGQ